MEVIVTFQYLLFDVSMFLCAVVP